MLPSKMMPQYSPSRLTTGLPLLPLNTGASTDSTGRSLPLIGTSPCTRPSPAICVKSGNAAFLRGSSGAIESNVAIAAVLRDGLAKAGLPDDSVVLVEDVRREAAVEFMQLRDSIDCLIPRGGPSLIRSILDNATVPYVIDGDGNCHVYVHEDADLEMAQRIAFNAKVQRPGVCNAAETLLVHSSVAGELLPPLLEELHAAGVELVGDEG